MTRSRICILGLWHQGTVQAACFSEMGHEVVGVDSDPRLIESLNSAIPAVDEPKLNRLLRKHLAAGNLRFTTDYKQALHEADFAYIAIDTPIDEEDCPVLDTVFEAAESIGAHRTGALIVCVTAQVPVGTCERLLKIVRDRSPDYDCNVAYIPEFLRLGAAVDAFRQADRFVIGANDPGVAVRVQALYEPLGRNILLTNLCTAEMAKHASNAFLATSVSFINELADLCDQVGADALAVAAAMKLDRRIGRQAFLESGLGFAGGTLGRDLRALQQLASPLGLRTAILDAVIAVNARRREIVNRRLLQIYGALTNLQIGIVGLTYKLGTSTLRRSLSLELIRDLHSKGAKLKAYDPYASLDELNRMPLPQFELCADVYQLAKDVDALVLMTAYPELKNADLSRLCSLMRRPVFVDARNMFEPAVMAKIGFSYSGIGRGTQLQSHAEADALAIQERQ